MKTKLLSNFFFSQVNKVFCLSYNKMFLIYIPKLLDFGESKMDFFFFLGHRMKRLSYSDCLQQKPGKNELDQ